MYVVEQLLLAIQHLWSFGFHLLFLITIYSIPIIVAYKRNVKNKTSLTLLNIFLGWTFFVWTGCLVWAIFGKNDTTKEEEKYPETI